MRRTILVAVCAGFAALVFAKPASALPSSPVTQLGEVNAAGVIEVGRKDRYWRNRNYNRHYHGYSYRYRPYNHYYYGGYPRYRPYAYYGGYPYYGYGYWRRPGISFGFSF